MPKPSEKAIARAALQAAAAKAAAPVPPPPEAEVAVGGKEGAINPPAAEGHSPPATSIPQVAMHKPVKPISQVVEAL